MTGPEHYRKAEYHLETAARAGQLDTGSEQAHLGYAQVHATLALAAATALEVPEPGYRGSRWYSVAGGA